MGKSARNVQSTMLDASCPISPLLPYLLNINVTATDGWAKTEVDSIGSGLPLAIIVTVGSLLLLFAGARLARLALFLCGALVTFAVSMLVTDAALSAVSASANLSCITLSVVPVALGLLAGFWMLRLLRLAFS